MIVEMGREEASRKLVLEQARAFDYRYREKKIVAYNIKRLREERDICPNHLNRILGMGKIVEMIENGRVRPSVSTLIKLADIFGVKIGEFYRAVPR